MYVFYVYLCILYIFVYFSPKKVLPFLSKGFFPALKSLRKNCKFFENFLIFVLFWKIFNFVLLQENVSVSL